MACSKAPAAHTWTKAGLHSHWLRATSWMKLCICMPGLHILAFLYDDKDLCQQSPDAQDTCLEPRQMHMLWHTCPLMFLTSLGLRNAKRRPGPLLKLGLCAAVYFSVAVVLLEEATGWQPLCRATALDLGWLQLILRLAVICHLSLMLRWQAGTCCKSAVCISI